MGGGKGGGEAPMRTPPSITPLMAHELRAVIAGSGRYWPTDRRVTSLRALAAKGLVRFVPGLGWRLTERGHECRRFLPKEAVNGP